MRFERTAIPGVTIIELEKHGDDRGFFARAWCAREFEEAGLNADLVQVNLSYNRERGTLRGLHYQAPPHAEAKLVRCVRGALYDVVVDLRPGLAQLPALVRRRAERREPEGALRPRGLRARLPDAR